MTEESLADLKVADLLVRLADGGPIPGGGPTTALAGAMAAALVAMVCHLSIGRRKFAKAEPALQEILEETERLRAALMELADADTAAYGAVVAYGLPKGDAAGRAEAIEQALRQATEVPLQVAEACTEVAALAQRAVSLGNPNAAGDGVVARLLAGAAAQGAVNNVRINAAMLKDPAFVETARARAEACLEHLASAGAQGLTAE